MLTYSSLILAQEVAQDRQRQVLHELRLQQLLGDYKVQRRSVLQRLLGLLRPVAALKVAGRSLGQPNTVPTVS